MGPVHNHNGTSRLRVLHAADPGIAVPGAVAGDGGQRGANVRTDERRTDAGSESPEWRRQGAGDEAVDGLSGGGAHGGWVGCLGSECGQGVALDDWAGGLVFVYVLVVLYLVDSGWVWMDADNVSSVAAGIQIGNTITSAYIVDCYPLQSSSVVVFYAVVLNLSAFVNPVRCTSLSAFFPNEARLTK